MNSNLHAARGRRVVAAWVTLGAILILVVVASLQVLWNHQEFDVDRVTFRKSLPSESEGGLPAWVEPGGDPTGFAPINLPHFGAGYFRVDFTSSTTQTQVEVYARDCLIEAYLDGEPVYESAQPKCGDCSFVGRKRRCHGVPLHLDLDQPGAHVLALRTYNAKRRESSYNRDFKALWLEHEGNAAGWRAVVLFGLGFLLTMATIAIRRRSVDQAWIAVVGRFRRYRYVLLAFAVAMSLRVVVAPSALTRDVTQATMVYVENVVHSDSWRLTKLDPVYRAAKHWGKSYMHKPPGLYYQYVPARLWFGFTHFYYVYLSRLPGFLGDLLIGLGLFVIVRRKTLSPFLGNLAAVTYLAAPGPFMFFGYIGRVDALPIAFLLLAANNMRRRRFSVYFGLSALHKQFAVFAGPWFLFRPGMFRKVVLAALFTLVFMAPYLLDDPRLVLERMVSPQLTKSVSGLTWMHSLPALGVTAKTAAASAITVGYIVVLFALSPFLYGNPHRVLAWIYVSFILFARNIAEHYMLWPAPFLIAHCFISKRMFPLVVFGALQISGFMLNDRVNLLPQLQRRHFSIAMGVILAVYVLYELPQLLRPRQTSQRAVHALRRLRGFRRGATTSSESG